jgi:hypothetical protein
MTDFVLSPNENDFVKDHANDALYKQIASELTTRTSAKGKNKGGQKLTLTPEMLRDFLYYVSMGVNLQDSAEAVNLPEKTRQDYNRRSATFSGVTDLAKRNVSLRAQITIAKAIMGQMPQYYKIINPETNQPKYIELKEIPPNTAVAQWWLTTVDKIGGAEETDAPQLGAPRNEVEAELLERLLNKHYDYVESKKNTSK